MWKQFRKKFLVLILMFFVVCFAFYCFFFHFRKAFVGFNSVSVFIEEYWYEFSTGAFASAFYFAFLNFISMTFSLFRQIFDFFKEKQDP